MQTKHMWVHLLLSTIMCVFLACDDGNAVVQGVNNGNNGNNGANNGKLPPGESCASNHECTSGICADGVCKLAGGGGNNGETCDDPNAGECGNCDPDCRRTSVGGNADPFDLDNDSNDDETSQGVVLDDDGAITLDVEKLENHYIWIANTGEGTISKVDTRSFEEVARYMAGPDGVSNDPSRTSVNTYGEVFVGNRSAKTVTKISGLGEACPDSNGDGQITTSTGPSDVLPWGQDDCVIWNVSLPDGGLIRAVAAQDGRPSDENVPPAVWIGGYNGKIWKLKSQDGQVLVETDSPTVNYGFALDGLGNLWISGAGQNELGRLDTDKCTTTQNCTAQPCGLQDGDDCIKQTIPLDFGPYGITVDFKQRVWLGGQNIARYDPSEPVGQRFTKIQPPFVHGIAADDKGWVWGAAMSNGIIRVDADNPSNFKPVPGTELSAKGMAVDLDGKIWSINQGHANATVIEPGPGIDDHTVTTDVVPQIVSPYTYSDMTGAQLRYATDERGYYRRVFEGCPPEDASLGTEWLELRWDADTPTGAKISWRVRGANDRMELGTAAWIDIGDVPPETSPFDLGALLQANNLRKVRWIEVEAQLQAVRDVQNNVAAPRLKAMGVTFECPVVVQ